MGRTLGNESGGLYPWCLMRLPLADGKPISDKPINDRRRRKRAAVVKLVRLSFWRKARAFPSVPRRSFCARTTTYTTRTKKVPFLYLFNICFKLLKYFFFIILTVTKILLKGKYNHDSTTQKDKFTLPLFCPCSVS